MEPVYPVERETINDSYAKSLGRGSSEGQQNGRPLSTYSRD